MRFSGIRLTVSSVATAAFALLLLPASAPSAGSTHGSRPPETVTVATVIEGLQLVHADDQALLEQGMALFDALYRAFEQSSRSAGPRPLAKPRRKTTSTRGRASRRRRAR